MEMGISCLVLIVTLCLSFGRTARVELNGPELELTPGSITHFSNTVGLTLTCRGRGSPPLTITWLSAAGKELEIIPRLREQLQNGSLQFKTFRPDEYIPKVHNEEYRCSVGNPVGTFLSPIFSVRAVIDHPFELVISTWRHRNTLRSSDYNDLILEGSPVLLFCDVTPTFYAQFVKVLWKSIDQFGHETEITEEDNRYKVSTNGSLLILQAKYQQLFVCIGESTFNKKIQASTPFLLKSKGELSPQPKLIFLSNSSILRENDNVIRGEVGKTTDFICLAVGSPPPSFRWEKYHKGKFVPVTSILDSSAISQGPLLRLSPTNPLLHNGTFRCEVSNTFGTFTIDYHFLLEKSPELVIVPGRKLVRNGESIELTCKVKKELDDYRNKSMSNVDFIWFKNGKLLQRNSRINLLPPQHKLQIFNAKLEDQGVYQCFAEVKVGGESFKSIQASSSIIFEASAPEIVQTFISQSLQPGPSVSLKCSATGNPTPSFAWFVDDVLLSPGVDQGYQQLHTRISIGFYQLQSSEKVSHLNISQVRRGDSGAYRCEASNLVGKSFHSARLNIYGPIFVKEMKAITLAAGENAWIPCHYGGFPVDKVVWQKDSRDITLSDKGNDGKRTSGESRKGNRFTILANGTLQIERASKASDIGRFNCIVSNRKGEVASGFVDVNVMRPPIISSFKFDDDLREGQRTSISCNVISGDLPIDIIWFKDSLPLTNGLNATENRVMEFLSVLVFEQLHHHHSGEWTCSASNAATVVKQSAELKVKVPPYWIKEPEEVKVVLNSAAILPCSASGVPKPTVSWYRESSSGVGLKSSIRTDQKFQQMEDGSLKILQVGETDASIYVCEAINGVGNGISKSIQLHVMTPAKVSATMTTLVVAEGLPALLKCEMRGDPPVQVSWKKDSVIIEPQLPSATSSRLVQHETVVDGNSSVVFAELRIDSSERADSGFYGCIASNQYGWDEDRINLEVKARPLPPENLRVEEIGSRFIRLRWFGADWLVPVTHFLLQWKTSTISSWEGGQVFNMSVKNPSTQAVIESLNPITNYDIRLFAFNDIGHSFPTEALSVLTLPEAPSGSPTNVSAIAVGSRTINVRWEPPDPSLTHGEILGYQVTANLQSNLVLAPNRNGGAAAQKKNETIILDQKWELQAQLNKLQPNSQYKISVKAYNNAGIGPTSPFIFVQTPEGAPDSPPIYLHCEALSPKSLQVQWEPPPFHLSNGHILGYKVIYLPLEAEEMGVKGEVKKTSNRETTLHGLRSFTSYSIRVLAYTLGGESNMSEPANCMTEEDIPEEPADIKVIPISGNSVLVNWLPPIFTNGVITKFTIFWKAEESSQIKEKEFLTASDDEDDNFSQEIRRLQTSKKYMFWVKASTNVGMGKSSRIETIQLSSKVKARIASFPVVKYPRLGLSAILPCKAIGIPSPKVFWIRSNPPLPPHIHVRNGSLLISRVKDSDEGVYKCKVENEHGSDEIEHRVLISRPPPQIPIFIGYVTESSIQIHWDLPEHVEPPLRAYVLQYQQKLQSSSSKEWKSIRLGPRLTSYLVENLLCGAQYLFSILGENWVGKGELSKVLSARTNGNPPEIPKLTEVLDGNGTMIRIDLSRWSDGGCPISSFNIEYKKASFPGSWMRIYKRDNSTRLFVIQTELSGKYDIKIRVENDAGSVVKVFKVESHPDFFTNYAKMSERVEKEEAINDSNVSFYTDPHVVVPIVSGIICTFALAVCVLMLVKRRNQAKSEWRIKQSSSQQTWLSSSDGMSKCAGENGPGCPEAMSIYATLNSTKPIPMTIRNSTLRLQSFGQNDNYEAPTVMLRSVSKRSRRKSGRASTSLEEMHMQQVPCQIEFPKEIEPPSQFRSSSIPNQQQKLYHHHQQLSMEAADDSCPAGGEVGDGLYHDYCSPYQFTTAAPGGEAFSRC